MPDKTANTNKVYREESTEGQFLQSIENAIRNALTKADSADPAMRQRIYESVWSAHERAMAANSNLSEGQRTERREKLKTAISHVEQEMRVQTAGFAAAPAVTSDYDGGLGVPELDRDGPPPSAKQLGKRRHAAVPEPDLGYEQGLSQPARGKKRKKSRLLTLVLPAAFLLTAGFIGLSLYNSFVSMGPVSEGALLQSGNLGPMRQGDSADDKDWITIFTPQQPDRISVQGRASVQIGGAGNARYARISSPSATDTISFDIGSGVLDELEGKPSVFEVIVRSDDGSTVQMSVRCDFGVLGDCGRKRYDVTDQQTSLLFDVSTAEVKAPNSMGRIIFTSDMSGEGKSVDIYAIRAKKSAQ